jgi:outer membrane protein insertion porin family
MAAPPSPSTSDPLDDDVFSHLQKPIDPAILAEREKSVNERMRAQFEKSQQRQNELVGLNSTRPISISSVRVLHAYNTRHDFLARIFNPILSQNRKDGGLYTLREALEAIGGAVDKLNRLDIFHQPISTYIDRPDPTEASSSPTDHSVFISVKEKGRYTIKTGTEAGTLEGSAYLNVVLRNLFGGAESLNANASLGTRTRSAYNAYFDSPILSNPDLRWEIGGLASSTLKPWSSHEEVLKGGSTRLLYQTSPGHRHELSYSGFWRQLTGLAEKASPAVRGDAGDSFKSAISHTWVNDTRDIPMLPSRGYLFKTITELAGLGQLRGDVAHAKFEMDSQVSVPVPLPNEPDTGISFTAGFRGGLLYPLALSGDSGPQMSRLNDRFFLGGPTDVRGFRMAGLGPRDGQDALGGDVYAAGGASLLLPLPRVGKDTPLRFQMFVNGGRLLALQDTRSTESSQDTPMSNREVANSVLDTVHKLGDGLPSCAAGFGLVYAHPVARFEVNFSLPLVIRRGEEGRKGVSFGIGLSFL